MESVKYAAKVSVVVGIFHIICILLYLFLVENAHIPFTHIMRSADNFVMSNRPMSAGDLDVYFNAPTTASNFLRMKLGLLNCVTLHLTVIGSFLLAMLGGYGLALFPMEFLNSFLNRPQLRDAEDYTLTKCILRMENEKMIEETKRVKKLKEDCERTIGFIAQRAKKMALQREVNALKAEYLEFEEVIDCFKQEQNIQEVNPLVHLSYLVVGCIGFVASFLIIFHTMLYNIKKNGKPLSYLLNNVFEWITQSFAQLVALAFWLIMSFYMLICIVKGNLMFGSLLSSVLGVHPFK